MLAMPLEPAATALSRKRPRVGADTPPQRLLSFASLSAATPRAGVLPTISQLLSQQQQQQQQQQQLSPPPMLVTPARQRLNTVGDFVERRHDHASPAKETVSSSSTTPATASEDEDDETEDKTPWPSAAQYHDIFRNLRAGDVPVYDLGVDPRGVPLHPEFIYSQPVSCMYFLKCAQLLGKGSFGFPRKKKAVAAATSGVQFVAAASAVDAPGKRLPAKSKKESSKDFEWRKMSFVTGLPKKQPVVRYITATCYSRASDVAAKKKVFRMHAVMLASDAGDSETGEYVLVHIRAGGSKRVGLRATAGDVEVQDAPASPLAARPECVETVSVPRPISPPQVVAPSYDSQAASSSPCNKKLLHADLSSSHHFALNQPIGAGLGKFQLSRSPPQMRALSPSHFGGLQQQQQRQPLPSPPAMARHPTFDSGKLASARQAMRDMILQSCNSRDEMAEYVHCLQEELAALQQQTARS